MSLTTNREQRRALKSESLKFPAQLQVIPQSEWPTRFPSEDAPVRVWRSREFFVMQFAAPSPAACRLSALRTAVAGDRWQDGISWDDLQRIKRECGFGELDAVEIYPRDRDVVNVANIRHLWVMEAPLAFKWRNS